MLFQLTLHRGDEAVEFVDDLEHAGLAFFFEEADEGIPKADAVFIFAVEKDDGLAFHERVGLGV